MKHKDQRMGVFVDVQNMYYSARHLHNSKVSFSEILKVAVVGRKLIRAICYVVETDETAQGIFFEVLAKQGFEVRRKSLQTFYGGAKKGDWDVGIAMDIMRLASKLDVIVLVSGDGDFVDLLEHAKSLGCRVEVMAFGGSASSKLIACADSFIDLDKNKKFLIAPKRSRKRK